MKSIFPILLSLLCCLPSCMVATPTSFATLGTDATNLKVEWNKGFSADAIGQSKSYTKTVDLGLDINRSIATVKTVGRFFDSKDADTAATTVQQADKLKAGTANTKILADKEIALKGMELEAAAIPAP